MSDCGSESSLDYGNCLAESPAHICILQEALRWLLNLMRKKF